MNKRSEYVRTMQAKLDTWSLEIETLTNRTCSVTAEVQSKANQQVSSLKSKLEAAWGKIGLSHCIQRAD